MTKPTQAQIEADTLRRQVIFDYESVTDLLNATIERCAQICDYERDDLAARIRALKEKP